MSQLQGKVALITGGNSGIGLATARQFLQAGAQVIITGRRQQAIDQAVKELSAFGTVSGLLADVSDLAALEKSYQELQQQVGKIDILFANAGVAELRHISEVDEAFYDKIMDTNVKGLFFTVQKALPLLRDGGAIVLNGSVVATKGMANFSVYAATKAAVRSFARSWATDLKDRQIRVNVVSPGPIETPIYGKMGLPEQAVQEFGSSVAQQVPLGRFGQDSEIASAVLFLASDAASYVNGADLSVDGGLGQV